MDACAQLAGVWNTFVHLAFKDRGLYAHRS